LHSTLSIQAITPPNHSTGSSVDDFPIQRMSVLALNYWNYHSKTCVCANSMGS